MKTAKGIDPGSTEFREAMIENDATNVIARETMDDRTVLRRLIRERREDEPDPWRFGDKRPPASHGLVGLHSGGVEAEVEVEVELDAPGGVEVSARDAETGRKLPLKVREPERPSAPARPKPLVPDCELQEDGPGDLGSLARDLLPAPESLRLALSRPAGRSPEVSRLREAARKTLKILEEALAASGLPGTAPPVGEPAGPAPSPVPAPPPSPGGGIPEDCPGSLESLVRDALPALDSLRLVLSRPEGGDPAAMGLREAARGALKVLGGALGSLGLREIEVLPGEVVDYWDHEPPVDPTTEAAVAGLVRRGYRLGCSPGGGVVRQAKVRTS